MHSFHGFLLQFYFILNVAVGGVNNFFPDGAENAGGKPWLNSSPKVPIHQQNEYIHMNITLIPL
jgi:hypothetical protein